MPIELYMYIYIYILYQVVSLIYVYVILCKKELSFIEMPGFRYRLYMGIHVHGQIELP